MANGHISMTLWNLNLWSDNNEEKISGVTGGRQGCRMPPRDFWPGNFCWPTGKKGGKEKREKGWKLRRKGKFLKGKVENWKWKVEKLQNEESSPPLFFHLSKPLKFVLGLPKWKFSTGKKHFTPGEKSGKMTLPPQKNFPVMPLEKICSWGVRNPFGVECQFKVSITRALARSLKLPVIFERVLVQKGLKWSKMC